MKSPIDFANELKELMVKHNVNTMKPSNMEALLDTKAKIFMTNFTVEFNGESEYNEAATQA